MLGKNTDDQRMGHLIETVHLAAKYMINEGRGDPGSISGYSAVLVLEQFKDPLFELYRNDEDRLKTDISRVLKIMEDHKVFSKDESGSRYVPPEGSAKVESLLTYDTKIGQIVDYSKFEPPVIKL